MRLLLRFSLLGLLLFTLGMSATYAQDNSETQNGCVVTAPPSEMKLDPFYAKYCDVDGVPILSSAAVPDEALQRAWDIASHLLSPYPDLGATLAENNVKIGIIGANEVLSDLPDYKDIYTLFPGTDWDTLTRGVGATATLPMTSGAEENLLCYVKDSYRGEDIFVHEFSHTVKIMGLQYLDSTFEATVLKAYNNGMAKGLWADTYAATNAEEYWAEGIQDYFNVNLESDPANGIHNFVNTRDELKAYDPTLFGLIDALYKDLDWQPACPASAETATSSGMCSGAGTAAANIVFENQSNDPVEIFWVNQACEEISYGVIEPGMQQNISSYATHVWALRSVSGVWLKVYETKEGSQTVPIQLPCSQNGSTTQLTIQNKTQKPLSLAWISYDCQEILYASIPSGQQTTQSTYANNVWILRSDDGVLQGLYIAQDGPMTITLP